MNIDGLFTILAIIIALYTLAQPIQRKTVSIFVPIWLLIAIFLMTTGIIIWRESVSTLGYELYAWSDLGSKLTAIFIPILGLSLSVFLWYRAKLGIRKDFKFRDFIYTSINEDKYDELDRILRRNEGRLYKVIESDTIDLIFDRKVVESLNRFPDWLHISLLKDKSLFEKLNNPFSTVDVVMRNLISKEDSILQSYVASTFGGLEYPRLTKLEQELIEETFEDPHWYIDLRIDYPLVIFACERIDSGVFDIKYNQNDDFYIRLQGISGKIKCPIYLFIKIHYIALDRALEFDDRDYYVSDLWDIFRNICNHIEYNRLVWENPYTNREYPTPYIFLVKAILNDLRILSEKKINKGKNPPGRIGDDLVRIWYTCVSYISRLENKIPFSFISDCIGNFLDLLLEIRENHGETKTVSLKSNLSDWCDLMLNEIKRLSIHDDELNEKIHRSITNLDKGKYHILNNVEWLLKELVI